MNLIVIYGPPGVGKSTTAKKLAKITGYRFLSNNVGNDFVGSIFEKGSEPFRAVRSNLRLILIGEAAKRGITGLIFIYCPSWRTDRLARRQSRLVKKYKGKIFFVQLVCDETVLYKRVENLSRRRFDKVLSVRTLKRKYEGSSDLFYSIRSVASLRIDNTRIPALKVAHIINRYYKLS